MPERVNFGKLKDVLEIPDLIGIQVDSYKSFLQLDVPADQRKNQGLQEVFNEVFPIESFDKQMVLEFVSYSLGLPKQDVVDCIKDGNTYSGKNLCCTKEGRLSGLGTAAMGRRISLG